MWGVIPAAGRGSRMEEHHVDGCKELIEIGGRSMLLRTVDELVAAGVTGIAVVTSPEKPAIAEALADFDAADLEFVEQSEPEGIVDALRKAREVVGDEMLVASPDNLFIGHPCPSAELLSAHRLTGKTVIGAVQVTSPWGELLSDTGRINALNPGASDELLITGICEKQKDQPFPMDGENWRCTGRMLLTSRFWEEPESDDVQMLDSMASSGELVAAPIAAAYIDIGLPEGLAYANSRLN
jgi:UTP-glucose-1-phosphate uridylyltransferase